MDLCVYYDSHINSSSVKEHHLLSLYDINIYVYIIWAPLFSFFQFSRSSVCVFNFLPRQI